MPDDFDDDADRDDADRDDAPLDFDGEMSPVDTALAVLDLFRQGLKPPATNLNGVTSDLYDAAAKLLILRIQKGGED